MTAALSLPQRLLYFSGVGGCAAIIHLLVVLNLVTYTLMQPLIANIFAFLIAFNFSFIGHKYLTFSKLQDQRQLNLPRFFLIASSAGIINEGLYFLLLNYTALNYMIALFLVLTLMAVYTFILSRFWGCKPQTRLP